MEIDISFVSTIPGLESIEECRPVAAKKFIPSWIKSMPHNDPIFETPTVKKCPGIIDYFSQGYIIPMWADVRLSYDKETNVWNAFSGLNGTTPKWSSHGNHQFLEHAPAQFLNRKATFVFKAISPWKIITKPGWSVYQMPLFYHFDNRFSVLPGVIDTDIHHEINQQVLYFGDNEDIIIKRGTPFVQYIPFKRESIEYDVRQEQDGDTRMFAINDANAMTKFNTSGFYRLMQRSRKNG